MQLIVRLVLPLVLAVALHAIPRLASPLIPDASSEDGPTTLISAHSRPRSNVQISSLDTHLTVASTKDAPVNVTSSKKHIFPVPDTDVVLTISLGKRLDIEPLASLVALAEDLVIRQVGRDGADTVLPMGMFEWDLGEGLEILAENSVTLEHQMTWVILMDAIKGLQEFLDGLENYREAACQVSLAGSVRTSVGYINLRIKPTSSEINVRRSLPTIPVVDHHRNISAPSLDIDDNIHIDLRPSWRRLDFIAVRNVLVITQDWAEENIERGWPGRYLQYPRFERSLGEGVELNMAQAPGKHLTYGLVLETVKRLLEWETTVGKGGKGKAVEFGILDHGIVKGAGSIRKEKIKRLESAR
ncbi:MAG: hypothetical protein Q9184_001800 [Pyrenodesmia sp. 2 TL-2023]